MDSVLFENYHEKWTSARYAAGFVGGCKMMLVECWPQQRRQRRRPTGGYLYNAIASGVVVHAPQRRVKEE